MIFVEKYKILEIVQSSAVFFKHIKKKKNYLSETLHFSREVSAADNMVREDIYRRSDCLIFPFVPPPLTSPETTPRKI